MIGKIFNIQRFSLHDGPGVRTTFFLMGCSLRCRWCHNPEGLSGKITLQFQKKDCIYCRKCEEVCNENVHTFLEEHIVDFTKCINCNACIEACPTNALSLNGAYYTQEQVLKEALKDKLFYRNEGGVTFSGGEALLQADFVGACAKRLKEENISVFIDTAGNVEWEAFEKVLPYVDGFLYDVKAYSEKCHIEGTKYSNKKILENLKKLDTYNKKIYIRIPLIPSINDNEEEFIKIKEFLDTLHSIEEIRVLPYHTFGREKYVTLGYEEVELFTSPSDERLQYFQDIMAK